MFNFFSKNKIKTESVNYAELMLEREVKTLRLPYDRIIQHYDPAKKSVVIIDDSSLVLSMVQDYLKILGITEEKYNIFQFYGVYAPFVLKETLNELKEQGLTKIDHAIVDIVLPGKLQNTETGKYEKMDGIDVAILLNKHYCCNSLLFFSGNILNAYLEFIEEKINKFKKHFTFDLRKYIVVKTTKDTVILDSFKEMLDNENYLYEKSGL